MKRWLMYWFFAPRSQRYFWTKEWQRGEREADAAITDQIKRCRAIVDEGDQKRARLEAFREQRGH